MLGAAADGCAVERERPPGGGGAGGSRGRRCEHGPAGGAVCWGRRPPPQQTAPPRVWRRPAGERRVRAARSVGVALGGGRRRAAHHVRQTGHRLCSGASEHTLTR